MVHQFLKPTDKQSRVIQKIARLLAPQVNEIMHRWEKAYREMDRTIDPSALYEMQRMYWAYFMMLLEEKDVKPFENRIAAAAKRLSQMQVSFDHLILSFHLIEDSFLPYIRTIYYDKERLIEAMIAMDYMCHACFSAIANSYFQEKYAKTAQSPQQKMLPTQLIENYQLTRRESEVLKRIVDGYKNREIAEILRISVKTVEHHRASLMRKLRVHNSVDLTKFAIRNSLA